jgi:hypothetical protein
VDVIVPALGTALLGQPFGVPTPLAATIILGAMGIAMVVAAAVAWHPARVRPLEVLRYE